MEDVYEIIYERTEVRRAGVYASSREEALKVFEEGDWIDDDGVEMKDIKAIDVYEA